MLWHGGSSYEVGYIDEDTEEFPSLAAAKDAFAGRADTLETYYPCVSEDTPEDGGPSAQVFFADPREFADPYPDRVLSFGPRGGVRVEHA